MTYIGCKSHASLKLHRVAFTHYAPCMKMPPMAPSYLKEWRKHRHLTQDEVVGKLVEFGDPKLPQTAASLSRIEAGKQIYTQRTLEALAGIYECEPADLLGRNPEKAGDVIDMLARLSETQVRQIKAIIEALTEEPA